MFSAIEKPIPTEAPNKAPWRRLGIAFQMKTATISILRALNISSVIGAMMVRRAQLAAGIPVASCRTNDRAKLSVAPRIRPMTAPFFRTAGGMPFAPCSRMVRFFLIPKSRRVSGL